MEECLEILNRFPSSRQLALINLLGGPDICDDILSGKKEFRVEDKVRVLFDKHGRFIPFQGIQSSVIDANCDFYLKQPKIDYGLRLAGIMESLHCDPTVSAAEFEDRSKKIIVRIKNDEQLSNLLKGVHLPIVLPQTEVKDYGQTLEEVFLPAVERAYKKQFPNRAFNNYRKGELVGQVSITENTRYEKLLSAMAKSAVVAVYFPVALQGFSIPADREIIATLPEDAILSGAYDIYAAMSGYPDILARDFKTPGLDMAAFQYQSAGYSLDFKALGVFLSFDYRSLGALGSYSGGLVFLG